MNALFRKELRQILPAQLFLTALFSAGWFLIVAPDVALAPYDSGQVAQHALIACFCLILGLVLGLGQFGSEHWSGTQAFLVHRGTGHRGAFHAKVLAGLIGLAPLVVVPPTAFVAVHVLGEEVSGRAAAINLLRMVGAGSVAVLGYAIGVLAAQVQRGWLVRIGLALLGSLTGLLLLTVLYVPRWIPSEHPLARLLLMEALVAAGLLVLARAAFEEAPFHGQARIACFVRAAALSALCLPLLALASFFAVMTQSFASQDRHIVEDRQERLYIATRTDIDREQLVAGREGLSPMGQVYSLTDERGELIELDAALPYRGYEARFPAWQEKQSPELPSYRTLFAPFVDSLISLSDAPELDFVRHPEPFAWSGPWSELHVGTDWWVRVDQSTGTLWGARIPNTDPHWHRLTSLGTRVEVVQRSSPGSRPILCDAKGRRLWSATDSTKDSPPGLELAPLPNGDHFVGIEPLLDESALRKGLWQRHGGTIVRGELDLYAFIDGTWFPWRELGDLARDGAAIAEELPRLQRWTLSATAQRGSLSRVEVFDARTGQPRIVLELPPSSRAAELWCLTLPPVATWISWASPAGPAWDPRLLRIGLAEVSLLRGQTRTWIPALLLVGCAFLVRDLWRRLHHGGAPIELRLWWCGLTALLGLPAYVLCRLIEPRAKYTPWVTAACLRPLPRYEIRTA